MLLVADGLALWCSSGLPTSTNGDTLLSPSLPGVRTRLTPQMAGPRRLKQKHGHGEEAQAAKPPAPLLPSLLSVPVLPLPRTPPSLQPD